MTDTSDNNEVLTSKVDDNLPLIGITHGDMNGVGYEVILKAFEDPMMFELCTPVLYGSSRVLNQYRKMPGIPPVPYNVIASADDARDGVLNVVNVTDDDLKAEPGTSTAEAGALAVAALDRAVADLREGLTDALVTAPINKANVQSDKFAFAGHTEYLESALSENGERAMMILCTDTLRIALVTTHLPLREVSDAITVDAVCDGIVRLAGSLTRDFGVHAPRVAVLALNPHSGDGGLLGREESEVIVPAINRAKERGVCVFGPYAADGFFGSGAYSRFDGILAMYHDQGLAPFKALCMDDGVNFTAGLNYVRTSPDHGTGYDIAGKGEASAASMRSAIYRAIDVVRNRERHAEATRNPLRRHYHDKGKDNVVLDLTKDN